MKSKADLFLNDIRTARKESFKSVGEGLDIRLESNNVKGFAIVNNDEIVHIAAFPSKK